MKTASLCFVVLLGTSLFALGEPLRLDKIKQEEPAIGDAYTPPILKTKLKFSKENGRRFVIPIRLKGKRSIKLTIWHGFDNTTDRGMTWQLLDSVSKKEIAKGMSKAKKSKKWTIESIPNLNVLLILEDKDTKFTGKDAGNGFYVAVETVTAIPKAQ